MTETCVAKPLPRNHRTRRTGARLLLVGSVFFAPVASAGQGVWTSGGPYGGKVSALAVDPSTPSTIYAGISTFSVQFSAGVFKSTDSGVTWVSVSQGLSVSGDVRGLAIDPVTPSTLYAINGGVVKSTDSGGVWAGAGTGLNDLYVWSLAVNPSVHSTLYAGTSKGVFKSTDSAGRWIPANSGLSDLMVAAVAINPSNPAAIYAGTTSGGIFKSTDAGITWAAVNTGLTTMEVRALVINPTAPATVYAGTKGGGIFKSTDAGSTWVSANTGLTNLEVTAVVIDPSGPSTLYAATPDGVFRSSDSGGTWVSAAAGLTNRSVLALAVNPSSSSTLFAGTEGGGVFRSSDTGGRWRATGIQNQWISALAIDPLDPSTLYAGTAWANSVGMFKSIDSGVTWSPADAGLPWPMVSSLAIDPVTPSTLYAGFYFIIGGAFGGLSKSTDAGVTWVPTGTGLPSDRIAVLAINPSNPSTLYAGTGGSGVFKSVDSGATWGAVNTGLVNADVRALVIDPATPSTLYAACAPHGDNGLVFGDVFKSEDSGATWAAASAGLPNLSVSVLAINRVTPRTLYAGTYQHGVFKSTDSGGSWVGVNAGLLNRNVTALVVNSSIPTTLYAATERGLFTSSNAGATWAPVENAGLPEGPYSPYLSTPLVLDPTGASTLYSGLTGSGVWELTSPSGGATRVDGFVPIVLNATGYAHYTSELQLTNLGATPATVKLSYTSSIGSGAGDVMETIPPGQQVVYPDAISYFRTRGLPIPESGSQGGTLLLSAAAASVHATVRTGSDTTIPAGRAGLAYTGTDPVSPSGYRAMVYGLRANETDRSNLAVYNMGASPVSLTVALMSGDDDQKYFDVTAGKPLMLPPYGWYQYNGILDTSGFSSGYAIVSGGGAFGAYGVVNDKITNDGSFISATADQPSPGKLTLPVLVETSSFESELILADPGHVAPSFSPPTTYTLRYVESLSPAKGRGGTTTIEMAPGRQMIIPNAIEFLRSKGVDIGARGEADYAGSLELQVSGSVIDAVFAGARTSALSPAGGKFGVFYPAIDRSQEFSDEAYVLGLKSDANNRSNVAALHTGAEGSGPITLELQVLDGSEGGKAVGQPLLVNLNPGQWVQPAGFFASGGVPNGYVRIRRTAGTAPWYAYGVINDGGQPGQRTGDGSYVPGVRP